MLKSCPFKGLQPHPQPWAVGAALLILRLVAGSALMIHGWGKMQHPFDWMGPQAPVPAFFQFLAAFSELGGGLAWTVGLLTPLAGFGIFCTMTVAVATHALVLKDPFVNPTGGSSFELALGYWSVALLLMTAGAGPWSLDAWLFGLRHPLKAAPLKNTLPKDASQ